MEKIYNKLVRDNIPKIIENDNEVPITRVLSNDEYKDALYQKLFEECYELINATSKEDILNECADVYEILKSISEFYGENINEVEKVADEKRLKRGGFTRKIFLEKTVNKK